jgi:hypothetical protein
VERLRAPEGNDGRRGNIQIPIDSSGLGEMVLREGRECRCSAVLRFGGNGDQVRWWHSEAHSGHGGYGPMREERRKEELWHSDRSSLEGIGQRGGAQGAASR